MTIGAVLASRGSIGAGLAVGRGGAAAAVADWWLAGGVNPANAVAAYQPIGAASLADSYVNLANPGTYNLTVFGVPPTWAKPTGWGFDGSAKCLTAAIPFVSGTWTILIRFSGLSAGMVAAWLLSYIWPQSGGLVEYAIGNTFKNNAPNMSSGVLGIVGNKTYRNGAIETGTMAGTGTSTRVDFGTYNRSTNLAAIGNIQAAAIYNITLTPTQVAELSANMAALTG